MPAHRELRAWQEAVDLAAAIHGFVRDFPEADHDNLGPQMERTALSVASTIAQGQGLQSNPDYLRCIKLARGSLAELDTQVVLSERFGYGADDTRDDIISRIDTIASMLARLRTTLVARSLTGPDA